jgi:hypothetical protein
MIEPFDPKVAAARKTINRSKDVEKSAKAELEQHRRWLKNYVAREARDRDRHLRRLELQRLKHERRLKRQHMFQVFRHGALAFGLFARSIGVLLLNISVTVAAWTGAKVQAFARLVIKLLSTGLAWLIPKGRAFALLLFNAASIGFAWILRKAHSLARSLAKRLSIGLAWGRVKGHAFALWLFNAASIGFAWVLRKAHSPARSLPKLIAATLVQARRYRERSSALAVRLFEKAGAVAQGLRRSAMRSGRRLLARSSASKNASSSIKEGTAIAEPDRHFALASQGEPLQHTGPGQQHDSAAAPLESESPANNQVAPSASSTELPAADNQAPVEAPSSKGRKHRKRRRRNTPGDFRARQKSNSDAA